MPSYTVIIPHYSYSFKKSCCLISYSKFQKHLKEIKSKKKYNFFLCCFQVFQKTP